MRVKSEEVFDRVYLFACTEIKISPLGRLCDIDSWHSLTPAVFPLMTLAFLSSLSTVPTDPLPKPSQL